MIARYTGWDENFILWELSMARGNAYCHSFMRMQNVPTESDTANDELLKMIDEI